jgi:hypothetical protein
MKDLGPFTSGEIPAPLTVTLTDSNGNGLDLTDHTAVYHYRRRGDEPVEQPADVTDETGGEVTYIWTEDDLAQAGVYTAVIWAGNGAQRYASEHIRYRVIDGPGPAPSI